MLDPEKLFFTVGIDLQIKVADSENVSIFLTYEVSNEDLPSLTPGEFLQHPICFQELIEKRFERRVFATTQSIVAFTIPEQAGDLSAVDWRAEEFTCGYRHELCPEQIETFCLNFLKAYGLTHGVFDFAEAKSGETIFFECNPAGQWSVPARLCNVDIAGLMADQIIKGSIHA